MRLIDADALKEYIDAQKGRPFIGCTIGEALKMFVDEQPTTQPEPQWIPVSERLPDIGMTVLFCDIDGDEFIGHRALHWWWSVDEKVKNVIAWMPLPEAYKEGDERI